MAGTYGNDFERFLEQLKFANPIEDVMREYVPLTRSGSDYICLCPFHSEKTPSCHVYTKGEDPHFYCYGCHAGGDVVNFVRLIENIGFMDAVAILAKRAGMTVPPREGDFDAKAAKQRERLLQLNLAAARYYAAELRGSDKRGIAYLKNRGLSPQIVAKYGLGYSSGGSGGLVAAMRAQGFTEDELYVSNLCGRGSDGRLYERFRGRVIFPIIDVRGSVIAFGGRTLEKDGVPKYLNSSDTPVFQKGNTLFSLNFARKSRSKQMILAEGYMDVIAVHQGGFENVVASLGTSLTPAQCRLIRQSAEEVILSYDSDEAGQKATVRAVNLLRQAGLKARVLKMEGAKDPDEFLKKYGSDRFRLLLNESRDAVSFLLDNCKEQADLTQEGGAADALRRSVSVLAEMDSDLERELYYPKITREYGVSREALAAAVSQQLGKKGKQSQWRERKDVTAAPFRPNPVNPQAAANHGAARAEEQILCYLFRRPEALGKIREKIAPEQFVTEFHRRVYAFLCEKASGGAACSLSLCGEAFSPEEMSYLHELVMRYEKVEISEQVALDCVEKLLRLGQQTQDYGSLDDEEFAKSFEQKAREKRN